MFSDFGDSHCNYRACELFLLLTTLTTRFLTPLPQRQIPIARARLSVKKGATPTTEGRYLQIQVFSQVPSIRKDSHGSEAKACDEAVAWVDHGEGGSKGGGEETTTEWDCMLWIHWQFQKFFRPDLAIIAPEMQTALGPNLLTSFPTIGPLKE